MFFTVPLIFYKFLKFLCRALVKLLNFIWIFQKLRDYQIFLLVGFFSESSRSFEFPFSYHWLVNILEFSLNFWKDNWTLYCLLKNEMGSLMSCENVCEHISCGGTDLRTYKWSRPKVAGELYISTACTVWRYTVYTSVYNRNRFTVHSIHYI